MEAKRETPRRHALDGRRGSFGYDLCKTHDLTTFPAKESLFSPYLHENPGCFRIRDWWGKVDSLFCGKATAVATVHRTVAKSPLSNPPSKCPNAEKRAAARRLVFLVGEGGFEPPKAVPADLQSVNICGFFRGNLCCHQNCHQPASFPFFLTGMIPAFLFMPRSKRVTLFLSCCWRRSV